MNEQLKNRILIFCVIAVVITLIASISSGLNAQKNETKFHKEMALRLEIEERLENSKYVISALEAEVKRLQGQVTAKKESCQDIEEALKQEKLVNQALKEELVKMSKLNESLENSLKEALTR